MSDNSCANPNPVGSGAVTCGKHSPRHESAVGPQVIVVPVSGRQTVLWVIAVLLAIIATALVDRWDTAGLSRKAMAQQASAQPGTGPMGARGIYAFTGQLGPKEFGLFMMDVDSGTIWCYQMGRSREGELQMQLVAARCWIFDRFLEEFNVAKPTPTEVQLMVRQQRGHANLEGGGAVGPAGSTGGPASQPAGATFAPAQPKEDNVK